MIRRLAIGAFLLLGTAIVVGCGVALWWTLNFSPDAEVVYRRVGDAELVLQVFEPPEGAGTDDGPRPAILFFFGGGWMGGSPMQFHPWARKLSEEGWVGVTADYRVNARHGTTAFAAVEDAEHAYRFLRAHVKELRVDPDRIVLAGGSAGGHLAATSGIIATENDPTLPEPAALVLLNPAIDTKIEGEDDYLAAIAYLFEGRGEEISPSHHVRPGLAPTLIVHGTGDGIVPVETAKTFCQRMHEAGNFCELKLWEGAQHGFFNYGVGRFDEVYAQVAAFLEARVR